MKVIIHFQRGALCLGATSVLYLLSLPMSQAAEWYLEPSVTGKAEYNDNIRMQSSNEISTTEYSIKPELSFGRRTERSDLQGVFSYEPRRFSEDGLDTNDRKFAVNSFYNITERQRATLNLSLVKDTTLESELEETGIIYSRTDRQRISVNPGWTYVWDERTSLSANLGYNTVDYADETNTGLRDYDTYSASFSVGRQFSPTTLWRLALGATRYERDDGSVTSDNQQLTLGIEHNYSQRLKLSASAGARKTETEIESGALVCPPGTVFTGLPFAPCSPPDVFQPTNFIVQTVTTTNDSTGGVASADASYKFERGSVGASLSRSVSPSATSGLIVTDRLSLDLEHRFTQLLTAGFRASWYQSQNTDDSSTQLDRTYYTLSPSLRWSFARDWRFVARYRYRKQEREGALDSATGNVVSFALTYNWPPYTKSR